MMMLSTSIRTTWPLFLSLMLLLCGCGSKRPDQRWVHDLELKGVEKVDDGDLEEGLATQETSWWSWTPFADKQWYDPAALDTDVSRIETFYAARGFFDAKVTGRQVKVRDGGKSVDIALEIKEGEPTKLVEVKAQGLEQLPADKRLAVTASLKLVAGERFDHGKYLGAKRRLQSKLKEVGYAYAKVSGEIEVDRKKRTAVAVLKANPGPLVRMGKTSLEGNGPLPEDKLMRVVTWKEGDTYDDSQLTRTKSRLFNQRVFSAVRVDLPKEPTSEADAKIVVSPSKLRELRLGAGIGIEQQRQEVHLKGRWIWRNFLGGLRTLNVRLEPAYVFMPYVWDMERHGLAVVSEVKLTQPDIFGTGILAFGLVGYDLEIDEGYRYHGPRLRVGVERDLFLPWLRAGLSWNLHFFDFFDIQFDESGGGALNTPLGPGFKELYRVAWLEQFFRVDLRDSTVDPRAGFFGEVRLEQGLTAVASDFNYFKVVPEVRGFVPLGTKRVVLALRAMLGYLRPMGGEESPVTRRLHLGGSTDHRGFSSGRLSPPMNGIPLGGNGSVLLSSDLRIRIVQLAGNWLGFTAFFDAGDCTGTFDDLDLSLLHLAVGGSLQYVTPIGAIRVGTGVRLNRLEPKTNGIDNPDPGQRIAFFLTIGGAF